MFLRIWVSLILLSLSSTAWAEGAANSHHSLIHRPQGQATPDAVAGPSATPPASQSALGATTTPTAKNGSSSLPPTATTPPPPPPHLPSSMQRLLRASPSLGQLLTPSSPNVAVPKSTAPTNTPPPTASTGKATLTWTPNKESDLAGYRIYVGTASGRYNFPGSPFTVGKITTYILTNLPTRTTYFFALSAYDVAGNESALSAEVSKSVF